MTEEENKYKEGLDVGKIVELTLFGFILLLGKYFNTVFNFVKNPIKFIAYLDEEGRSSNPNNFSRPLTFLSISLILVTSLYIILLQITSVNTNTFITAKFLVGLKLFVNLILDGLKTGDLKKLLLGISPFLLGAGLYSYMLSLSAKSKNLIFGFEKSIGLSAYLLGSVAYFYIIIVPVFALLSEKGFTSVVDLPTWVFIDIALAYGFLFRLIYCYFFVLKNELNLSVKKTICIWWGGIWRFSLAYFAIGFFVILLFLPLLGKRFI